VKETLELTNEENFEIFSAVYEAFKYRDVAIAPFNDIKQLLTQTTPRVNCTWNACDAVNTAAVQGVAADGSLVNCGRTNKDGVNWLKADSSGKERYLALYHTPLADGGCKGCLYFFACKGQCPGTAIDGDWRNKTSHCQFWYSMIDHIWHDLVLTTPVFREPVMRKMAADFIQSISLPKGQDSHADTPHGDSHGDHTDNFGSKGIPVVWRD
jgi:uncharacterized protein